MNIWRNAVITTAGLNLLAKLIEGNSLNIAKAIAGAGFVTPGLLQSQTAVTDGRQELTFASVSYTENGKCALTCRLNNAGIDTAYTAMQIGIYATDPDVGEILFFIAQAAEGTGNPIPSQAEMGNYNAEWTFYFQYGHADNVNVTVDPAAAVSMEQVRVYVEGYAIPKTAKGKPNGVASLDEEGKVPKDQLPGLGKRTTRITIGTSANGWTESDCDYLCDGTADEADINAAIAALPSTGGEIVLLDGAYKLAEPVVIGKSNVTLKGNGNGTKIVRAFSPSYDAMIMLSASYCVVRDLYIDGAKGTYTDKYENYGIRLRAANLLIENCVISNCGSAGIYGDGNYTTDYASIRGNTISNCYEGIKLLQCDHGAIADNILINNSYYGLSLAQCNYNTASGNIARLNGFRNISLYTSNYNTVSNNNCAVVDGDSTVPSNGAIVIQDAASTNNIVANNVVGIGTVTNNGGEGSVLTTARNITAGTEDLEAGVSELRTGDIYFVYE